MKTIAHISDLHFGAEDPRIVEGLTESIAEYHPSVVVISGDLTQRARKRQFEAAGAFNQRLDLVPFFISKVRWIRMRLHPSYL